MMISPPSAVPWMRAAMFTDLPEVVQPVVEVHHDGAARRGRRSSTMISLRRFSRLLNSSKAAWIAMAAATPSAGRRKEAITESPIVLTITPIVLLHRAEQYVEVVPHEAVCSGVPEPVVERRRALDVGEHDAHLADAQAFPDGERLRLEHLAEKWNVEAIHPGTRTCPAVVIFFSL